MDLRGFQEYEPGKSRYNGRISEDEWNRHKPKLRELHEQKLTRQRILEIISSDFDDIKPTYGQLCTKFDKWGFHVYRQNDRKDTAPGQNKKTPKKTNKSDQNQPELNIQQAFSPESSNGSTVVPDVGLLNLNDGDTPRTLADFQGTPQTQYLELSSWSDSTPRASHSRNDSRQSSTPPLGTIYEPTSISHGSDPFGYPNGGHTQQWVSATSLSNTTTSHGNRSSMSETLSSRTSLYHTVTDLTNVEPDDPAIIAARTAKADETLNNVSCYLRSLGSKQSSGEDITSMVSLAAYLFATRSYSSAFKIYRRIYEIMSQDMGCDDTSKIGALMRCFQSATEPSDLEFMQRELHQALHWNFSDSSLSAFAANMLQSVEAQISEGFNLTQGSVLSTVSITRNLSHLMAKGCSSTYPGTRRLYWRLRLLEHSPFHSGCSRLLRLMSEVLSWAWAAMAVVKFPEPALQTPSCLCKDGTYFDFVRMVTSVLLEAAMGFEISQLIKLSSALKDIPCACVMCADLEATFEICTIESFTAIALLTVDRCRLEWTSCHPGGRHQELTPQTILVDQLLPTIDSLLDQVAADIRSLTTIHTSDLYDDFLSCVWSTFETHDLPLRNSRFDASPNKVEDMMTTLITEELNKSHPARNSSIVEDDHVERSSGKMPVFTYGENTNTGAANDDLANKITAKRTRSNASSLKPSSSNASERSMIRIRKKLKFRTSADYLNSMSSYSSLSSRNSLNRFSYVTGLPELETVMDIDDDEVEEMRRRGEIPPDLTPDEFRTMMGRRDSWTRRSDHFSWVPSRPGSTVGVGANVAGTSSRPGSTVNSSNGGNMTSNGSLNLGRRASQKEVVAPHQQAVHNSIVQAQQQQQQQQQQYPQQQQQQNHQQMQPPPVPNPAAHRQPQTTSISIGNHYLISNQNNAYHNQNGGQMTTLPPPPQQQQQQQQSQPLQKPQRRDSNRTTRSRESQKGRWSSERDRVEGILKAVQ